jgi:heptosyltransferase-2
VTARLSGEFGASVVLLGSSHDRDAGYTIESVLAATCEAEIRRRVVNLIGRTDLSELIGLLACCRVLVSSDSGAMHLAAAVGVPVTAIFGPTDDRLTAPVGPHTVLTNPVWCRPCFFRDCPIDHRCMAQISEERVFQAVARQLVSSTEAQSPSN